MFTSFLSLALLAVGVTAARKSGKAVPSGKTGINSDPIFSLMAIRPGGPIQFAQFQATFGSLFLYLPDQGAVCDNEDEDKVNYAYFTLSDDEGLYLYSEDGRAKQQLYVVRSGMGEGRLGFTTGSQQKPHDAERSPFFINPLGELTFDGNNFMACPYGDTDSWTIWAITGSSHPAYNQGCLGFVARPIMPLSAPHSCTYIPSDRQLAGNKQSEI